MGVAVWTEYPIPRSRKGFGAFMNVPRSPSIHVDLLRMDLVSKWIRQRFGLGLEMRGLVEVLDKRMFMG